MARSVIAYDKDLPEIRGRLPWLKPGADLVKDPNAETSWLEYSVEGLTTQLYEVRAQGEQTIHRDVLAEQHNLSHRQALALSHILVHGRVSIQDFERLDPRVSRSTLQRDLKVMVDKGLITERASSPTDPTKNYILAEIFSD